MLHLLHMDTISCSYSWRFPAEMFYKSIPGYQIKDSTLYEEWNPYSKYKQLLTRIC
jgi:hypothetical protein